MTSIAALCHIEYLFINTTFGDTCMHLLTYLAMFIHLLLIYLVIHVYQNIDKFRL